MNTDLINSLEHQYIDRLDERCAKWQAKHKDEAKEIRESIAVQFRRPCVHEPEPGSLPWLMVEAAVNEAIRAKNGWPTFRRWLSERPPVRLVESVDHKQLAGGDR
jgi:hypothetical protein